MKQSIIGDKSLSFAKRIHSADYFTDEEYASLDNDNKELLRMLASIVKTSKEKE